MKHRIVVLTLICFLMSMITHARQNHFIYIQTENSQPFYVKLNNNVLSSSATGYIVIPKLKDGTYTLDIGFPRDQYPQQKISCTINKKDLGYVLKNYGEKGWGLVNLQTKEVLMARSSPVKQEVVSETTDDQFTQVLADVVNSPSLKNKTVAKEPKAVPEQVVIEKIPAKADPVKDVTTTGQPIIPAIRMLSDNKNENGREMLYVDISGEVPDTIMLFIPAKTKIAKKADPVQEMVKKEDQRALAAKKETESREKFIDIELENPNIKDSGSVAAKKGTSEPVKEAVSTVKMVNSDCKSNAGDNDFLKLRKKMASGNNEDNMISAARKAFKMRCYSTEQVKNLSYLFLNDAGRYRFFDVAYPFVHDSSNFGILQQQLTDPYFITRFQAMIRR